MSSKDGGYAFPDPSSSSATGMTMRQYYKAVALQGQLASGSYYRPDVSTFEEANTGLVNRAAQLADEMIAEDEEFNNPAPGGK